MRNSTCPATWLSVNTSQRVCGCGTVDYQLPPGSTETWMKTRIMDIRVICPRLITGPDKSICPGTDNWSAVGRYCCSRACSISLMTVLMRELFFDLDLISPQPSQAITNFIIDTALFTWAGLILGLRPANEIRRYKVTPSLIGWTQTWQHIKILMLGVGHLGR